MERPSDLSPMETTAKTRGSTQARTPARSNVSDSRCLSPWSTPGHQMHAELHTSVITQLPSVVAGLISTPCQMHLWVYFETKDRHIPPADVFSAFRDVCGSFLALPNPQGRAGLAALVLVFVFHHWSEYQITSRRRCTRGRREALQNELKDGTLTKVVWNTSYKRTLTLECILAQTIKASCTNKDKLADSASGFTRFTNEIYVCVCVNAGQRASVKAGSH